MVNGYESMDTEENPEDGCSDSNNRTAGQRDSYCSGNQEQLPGDDDTSQQQQVPTTTISTIALQSGDTRLVIALLQVRNVVYH